MWLIRPRERQVFPKSAINDSKQSLRIRLKSVAWLRKA